MTFSVDAGVTNAVDATSGRPWRRLQFGLAGLFVLTAIMAVGIVLLKNFGLMGLVAITAVAFAFTGFVVRRRKESLQPAIDFTWGIGLPILCFLYDPGVFRQPDGMPFFSQGVLCLALWQMTLLATWVLIGPRTTVWNAFLLGALNFGLVLSGSIGILLVPFALIGLFYFGMGLPGLAPLMTAYVFYRNWRQIKFALAGEEFRGTIKAAWFLGFISAFLGPWILVAMLNDLGFAIDLPKVGNFEALPFLE